MQTKDEFYVGYQPKAPKKYGRFLTWFVVLTALVLLSLASVLVWEQSDYANGTFELGKLSEVEGVLRVRPVPMLKVPLGKDINGNTLYQTVLLIDFGKKGAEEAIQKMEAEHGDLMGKVVRLEGTLIYHDGKSLLELTKSEGAFISAKRDPNMRLNQFKELGFQRLQGEIADPKCYFGVMKPGEGKPHRSCAARCISGGIPPVLKTINGGTVEYYLVLGANGQAINQEVLPVVGEQIQLEGQVEEQDEWKILKVDQPLKIERISGSLLPNAPMCTPQLGWKE
ncbi:MAG: hypothetical protein MRY78_09060 [Saprospiraceae bacterium]|nr:hypothetical protein [Saprospiraceae bacterium]